MNTKKILGIFVCMLVMTMIPVAAGATADTSKTHTSDMGQTYVLGIITQPKPEMNGAMQSFRCIFVNWRTVGFTQAQTGFLWGWQRLYVSSDFHGVISNHFIFARFAGLLPI
jgi:hypothetical protein